MDALLLTGLLILAGIGGFLAFSLLSAQPSAEGAALSPFCIVPVHCGDAATKAFLELLGGQIAWMDSSVLRSAVLMYPDEDAQAASLCEEMARQYDFFSCMSLRQAQALLEVRLSAEQAVKK